MIETREDAIRAIKNLQFDASRFEKKGWDISAQRVREDLDDLLQFLEAPDEKDARIEELEEKVRKLEEKVRNLEDQEPEISQDDLRSIQHEIEFALNGIENLRDRFSSATIQDVESTVNDGLDDIERDLEDGMKKIDDLLD